MGDKLEEIFDVENQLKNADAILNKLGQLKEAIISANTTIASFKTNAGDSGATDDLLKGQQRLINSQNELIMATKEHQKTLIQTNQIKAKSQELSTNEAKTLLTEKEALRQKTKELIAQGDAYKELELKSAAADKIAKELGAKALIDPSFAKSAQQAAKEADALKNSLKGIDDSIGNHQRHVGDYIGAISILDKTMAEVRVKMDQLQAAGRGSTQEYSELNNQLYALNGLTAQQSRGFSSLTMEVRNNERALQTMRAVGLEDSEGFKQLQLSVAEAKRGVTEFNNQQKLLSSTAPVLSGLTVAAKGLAGAYAIGAGTAALLADGDEKVEKEVQKLVAVMTVLQGLEEAHKLIMEKSAIATALESAAMKLYAFVVGESTGMLKAFRLALAATGIGLAIIAVAELVTHWDDLKVALGGATESQKMLNKIMADGNENAAKDISSLQILYNATQDVALAMDKRVEAAKELQSIYPETFKNFTTEQILLGDAKTGYDALTQSILANARAQAGKQQLEDLAKQKLDNDLKILDAKKKFDAKVNAASDIPLEDPNGGTMISNKKFWQIQRKNAIDELDKTGNEIAEKQKSIIDLIGEGNLVDSLKTDKVAKEKKTTETKDSTKTTLDSDFELYRIAQQRKIDLLNELSNDERLSFDVRKQMIIQSNTENIKLIDAAGADEVRKDNEKLKALEDNLKKAKSTERNNILIEIENTRNAIKIANAKIKDDEIKSNTEADTKIDALDAKAAADRLSKEKKMADETLMAGKLSNEKAYTDEIVRLDNLLDKKKISQKKYNQEKADADYNYQQQTINDQIAYNEKLILIQNLPEEERKKALLELHKPERELSELNLKHHKEQSAGKLESEFDFLDKAKKAYEVFYAVVGGLIKANAEKHINAIQKKEDANNSLRENEINNINASTLSAQERAARIQAIDRQTAAQNAVLEQKKRAEHIKEAQFEKANAAFSISVNTAKAIMKDAAETDPFTKAFFIAADAALGAAQLTAVLAAPIPKYAEGTDNHPGGAMIWGEEGKELAILPSGQQVFSPGHATLATAPRGTRIIPADEVNSMMMHSMIKHAAIVMEDSHNQKLDEIKSAITTAGRMQVNAMKKISQTTNINIDTNFWAHINKSVKE